MSEKVWREFCKDCGCPLEICCKPKKPVVEVEWLEKWCEKNYWNTADDEILNDLLETVRKQAKVKK